MGLLYEAVHNFVRYQTIFDPDWGQKSSLLFFQVNSWGCYIEAVQIFVRYQTIFERDVHKTFPFDFLGSFMWCYIEVVQNLFQVPDN